jgi:hypothetical protein
MTESKVDIRDHIAAAISGNEYGKEVSKEVESEAKAAGVVLVFGSSDDLMEFRGAIHDEIDCYDGGTAYLTDAGLLANDCDDDHCPHFERLKSASRTIEAVWDGDEGYAWTYLTDIPHATFEILDEGTTYCRGIAFLLADAALAACTPAKEEGR